MKDTYTIFFDAGKMMGFKMPEHWYFKKYPEPPKKEEHSPMWYTEILYERSAYQKEFNGLIESARAASLPVSDESKISVSKLILKSGITNIIPLDQTKEYSIEAQFREENGFLILD